MQEVELCGRAAPSADVLRAPPRVIAHAVNPSVTRMIEPMISLGVEPPDGCQRDAEAFHQLVGSKAERRRGLLRAAYDGLGGPDALVLMFCGERYLPLLERWLSSCDRRDIEVRDRSIVACLDTASEERGHELGVRTVPVDPDRGGFVEEADGFVDNRFAAVMLYKLLLIQDALEVVPSFLFQDVDLLWFEDPVPALRAGSGHFDLQFMFDGPNRIHAPLYANAGFFFVAANDATRSVFETAIRNSAAVLATGAMQRPLNRIVAHFVAHNLLRVTVLPEHRYLNGHLFNTVHGIRPEAGDWRRDGVVLHYSWTAGLDEKMAKLDRFGLR